MFHKPQIFILILGLFISPLAPLPTLAATLVNERLSNVILASARSMVDDEKFNEADELLTQSLLADPANAPAFALKGFVQSQLDNPDEALRLMDIALAIEPDNLQAVFWAGQAATKLENLEEAEKRLARLKTLCGECEQVSLLLADIDVLKAQETMPKEAKPVSEKLEENRESEKE